MRSLLRLAPIALLTGSLAVATVTGFAADEKWISLFDGKTLAGWTQINGEAKYEVREGAIVGTVVAERVNSFLATDETYADFVFECEFKVADGMNSGIQFRSHSKPDFAEGRVFGYQFEIDPTPRGLTGALYEERRRGWLQPTATSGEPREEWIKAKGIPYKNNEWNKVRIECRGSKIRTWLNDQPLVDYDDTSEQMLPSGFIALQVHQPGRNTELIGKEIAWRNLRIRRL